MTQSAAITYRDRGPEDFEDLFALVSIWEVARNLGSWSWPPDESMARERSQPFQGDGFVWTVCKGGQFAGTVLVVNGILGYMLHPDHHGEGIAQRAVQDALTHAFEHFDFDAITGDIWSDNHASRQILLKMGFVLEMEETVHALARNAPTPRETYRLTRTRWSTLMTPAE